MATAPTSLSDRQLWRPEVPAARGGAAYVGELSPGGRRVWVEERAGNRPLRCALDDPVFSFVWGRPGPRTRELARAMLQDATGDAALAERQASALAGEILIALPFEGFRLRRERVHAWVSDREPRSPR